jgi:hypothetical protein
MEFTTEPGTIEWDRREKVAESWHKSHRKRWKKKNPWKERIAVNPLLPGIPSCGEWT